MIPSVVRSPDSGKGLPMRAGLISIKTLAIGLCLAALVTVTSMFIVFGNPNGIPGALGGAIGLVSIPLTVGGIWRYAQHRRGPITNAPIYVAVIIFALLILAAVKVGRYEHSLPELSERSHTLTRQG